MAAFYKVRKAFRRSTTDNTDGGFPADANEQQKSSKGTPVTDGITERSSDSNEDDLERRPSEDVQRGIQQVEAATLTWGKWTLIWVFFNMWLLYFVNSMQSNVLSSLMPFITSDFSAQSLLNTVDVVAGAMSSAVYIPLAKLLDVWGRAEAFMFMTVLSTLSLVMMAACNNLYTYCAAYVFYNIGFSGVIFCVDVITADSSHLKNRGLAYAFTSSPYMITAFAGSYAAEAFYYNVGWRWGIGAWAIIFPVVAFPLFFALKSNASKAKKAGLWVHKPSGRTFLQNVWFHLVDFDIVGVVLFSCGLTVFLLPFTIASTAPNGWGSGYIIAMIVVGFVVLVLWGLWEAYMAPVPMLNYKLLTDRTVIAACTLSFFYDMSYYTWDNYFTSFLQVVNNVSLAEAGYISNAFEIVSGFLLFVVGYLMRRTGRYKWLLYWSIPFYIMTMGLQIYFRKPNQNVGYLVMCQVFLSISGSVFELVTQVGVESAVDHQHVSGALGLLNEVGTVGYTVGATISGAIWTNTYKTALLKYLPESALSNLDNIYNDLDTQLSYPPGNATRTAIQEAYGFSQTRMLAAGTGIMAITLGTMFLFKNYDLRKMHQAKGTIF